MHLLSHRLKHQSRFLQPVPEDSLQSLDDASLTHPLRQLRQELSKACLGLFSATDGVNVKVFTDFNEYMLDCFVVKEALS
jgi:hypothetical protein